MAAAAPTVRRRRLGIELRRLRERTGPTAEEIASRLDWSPSKLSRIENARIGVSVPDVRRLLDLYGVEGRQREELLTLADSATRPGWWAAYQRDLQKEAYARFVALEDEADSAANYVTYTVPGLLQTEEYARAVIESSRNGYPHITDEKIENRLEVRMRRQAVLHRENPLRFSSVIDESALMRAVAPRDVVRRQLAGLVEIAQLPTVELYVLPLDAPRAPVFGDSFTLLRFSPVHDVRFPEALYLDNIEAAEVQKEEVTYFYRLAWNAFRASALSHQHSVRRIEEIAARL